MQKHIARDKIRGGWSSKGKVLKWNVAFEDYLAKRKERTWEGNQIK